MVGRIRCEHSREPILGRCQQCKPQISRPKTGAPSNTLGIYWIRLVRRRKRLAHKKHGSCQAFPPERSFNWLYNVFPKMPSGGPGLGCLYSYSPKCEAKQSCQGHGSLSLSVKGEEIGTLGPGQVVGLWLGLSSEEFCLVS